MTVPEEVRKCVAFVAIRMPNDSFRLVGSGFFLGRDDDGDKVRSVRFVTARHVIDGIRKNALRKVYLRVNRMQDEKGWIETDISNWFQHPTDTSVDVAMVPCGTPPECDHVVVPLSICATEKTLQQHAVGLGDEVFITG